MNLIVACEYCLYVEAICKVLASEKDMKVVDKAFTPEDVGTLIMNEVQADLLILDVDMTALDLPQVLSLIRKKTPYLKVLLLTAKYDKEKFIEAIHVGYLLKSASARELVNSIQALVNREVWT